MRAWIVAGGVVVALGALVFAGRSAALPKEDKAPRTRIALLNMAYVVKNYDKYKTYQEELKGAIKAFQDRDKELKVRGEKLARELQDPAAEPARKESIEMKLKKLRRELEEVNDEARTFLGKKTEGQMTTLFRDIQDAAQRYARTHDFDLVLTYNDAVTEADLNGPQNVQRKLQAPALLPLYSSPDMEISKALVVLLNRSVREE